MRRIEIEEGLWIRFPDRDASFLEGVEIGVLAGLMASDPPEFTHRIDGRTFPQARALAEKLGYRVVATDTGTTLSVTFTCVGRKPKLRLVSA